MNKLSFNIAHLRKLKNLTQQELARQLNIKKSRLGSYEENRSQPPLEILMQLSDYFNLPIDILVKKDLTKAETIPSIDIGSQRVLFPVSIDRNNRSLIELVDLKASAGYLSGYDDPEYIDSLPKMNLPFARGGTFRAFPIKGDSMPPLGDGDIIVGKFCEDPKQVKDGTTCIVVTENEGIVYKRVFHDKNNKHSLVLHSDNSFYKPYSVALKDTREIWAFSCCINRSGFEPEENSNRNIVKMLKDIQARLETRS